MRLNVRFGGRAGRAGRAMNAEGETETGDEREGTVAKAINSLVQGGDQLLMNVKEFGSC